VLELTFREALRMGHNYIGTEHILLALAEFENGTRVLADLGIDKAAAEAHITGRWPPPWPYASRSNRPGGAAACPAVPASLIAADAGPTCQPLPLEKPPDQPSPTCALRRLPISSQSAPRHALPAR
jgi:hypothetical protein